MTLETADSTFHHDLIWLDSPAPPSKDELFRDLATRLLKSGRIISEELFIDALMAREEIGSTFMGNGIAIPHAKTDAVITPTVAVYRFMKPMVYQSGGEQGVVSRVFALAMPDGSDGEHLRTLAAVARMLTRDDLLGSFDAASSPKEVEAALREHLSLD